MADLVKDATGAVTAPLKTAKAHPIGFAVFIIVVILLGLRFKNQILSFLSSIPVVGGWAAKIAGGGAALVLVLFGAKLVKVLLGSTWSVA